MKLKIIPLLLSFSSPLFAQVIIGTNTPLAVSGQADIVIQTSGNVTNNTLFTFDAANLLLRLNGSTQVITGDWTVDDLFVEGDGNKSINGNFTITRELNLTSGYLLPVNGKLLFTGAADKVIYNAAGNSYIRGVFYQTGTGQRNYPIGTNGSFLPFSFLSKATPDEVGVEAFDSGFPITTDDPEVTTVFDRYWEIRGGTPAAINSPVTAGITGLTFPPNEAPTVLEADDLAGVARNLGSFSNSADLVTSSKVATAPIIGVGSGTEIKVLIRELITPFGSVGTNDRLFIENIERFAENRVMLLDRWGVLIKEWVNYTNDNTNYDFKKLPPGNYIVIVEYGNANRKKKISQMVTVIRTK